MEPFLGEIRLMAITFAPKGWGLCQGQLMSISQNTALFSLLGTIYGGNGQTTFGLPDLRGRTPVGMGQGPGLSAYSRGEITGTETVTLQTAELPAHVHSYAPAVPVSTNLGTATDPSSNYYALSSAAEQYGTTPSATQMMAADLVSGATGNTGGSLPHENRMPYLSLTYAIALEGVFPQRP